MSTFKHMDELLQSFVDNKEMGPAGCGCAIAQNGEIIYEGYYGYADIESKKPITADSVYRQFSMTKIAIYTVLMMLIEEGKILPQDPIYKFFPEWKKTNKFVVKEDGTVAVEPLQNPILVEHIMNMSCGLPYGHFPDGTPTGNAIYEIEKKLKDAGEYTVRDEIRAVSNVPVAFEPGTHWMYGFGSELAAGVIEVVTGKYIEDAVKDYLLNPLEMNDTGMLYRGDIKDRLVTFYYRKDGKLIPGAAAMDEKAVPGGPQSGCPRLYSSVRDYMKFTQMLANGGMHKGKQIIGAKTIDLMRANRLNETQLKDFRNPYLDGYGYGLGVRTMMSHALGNSNSSIGEFGWTGGSGTWASIDPSEKFSVVYMHNMAPNNELYHHLRVRACAYGCIE